MRTRTLSIPTAILTFGALAAMAAPAQAQTAVTKAFDIHGNVVERFTLQQANDGAVTVAAICTAANGTKYVIDLTNATAPKTLVCDGKTHNVTWPGVPAGFDKFTLTAKAGSNTERITLRITLP